MVSLNFNALFMAQADACASKQFLNFFGFLINFVNKKRAPTTHVLKPFTNLAPPSGLEPETL